MVVAARNRLEASSAVELAQSEGRGGYRDAGASTLSLSWSLGHPPLRVLALPCALGGFVVIFTSFIPSLRGPVVLGAVFGVLLLLSLVLHARRRSRRMTVTVDEERLRIEAGGEAPKELPLIGVDAIDFAWSGPLVVRIDGANEEARRVADGSGGGLAKVAATFALIGKSVFIDTGALSFALRHDLEVVLGAEVAARTGRTAGDL